MASIRQHSVVVQLLVSSLVSRSASRKITSNPRKSTIALHFLRLVACAFRRTAAEKRKGISGKLKKNQPAAAGAGAAGDDEEGEELLVGVSSVSPLSLRNLPLCQ